MSQPIHRHQQEEAAEGVKWRRSTTCGAQCESRLWLSRHRLFAVEVLRQPERSLGSFLHGARHRFLIPAQCLAPYAIAEIAGLDVQQNLYLPWLESITVHRPAHKLLQQLVKPRQNYFAILCLHDHPPELSASRARILNVLEPNDKKDGSGTHSVDAQGFTSPWLRFFRNQSSHCEPSEGQ